MIPDKRTLELRAQQTIATASAAAGESPPRIPSRAWIEGISDDEGNLSSHELVALNRGWTVRADRPITSHRPTVGKWIVTFKRVIRKCISWYVDSTFILQTNFNATVTRLINETSEVLKYVSGVQVDHSKELEYLTNEVSSLQDENQRLSHEMNELREQLVRLDTNVTHTMKWDPDWIFSHPEYFNYEDFQNHFRGSRQNISDRLAPYLEMFSNSSGPVVDLGCGRGEFVQLCATRGIDVIGVDLNESEIGQLRAQGYTAVLADALDFLRTQNDGSIGGILLAQVVEHMPFGTMLQVLREAYRTLSSGGRIVVETVNPQSLFVYTHALYVDPSHLRPVHPLTLEYCFRAQGYNEVRIGYLSEVPASEKLTGDGQERDQVLLNNVLFGPQDYYVVGERGGVTPS